MKIASSVPSFQSSGTVVSDSISKSTGPHQKSNPATVEKSAVQDQASESKRGEQSEFQALDQEVISDAGKPPLEPAASADESTSGIRAKRNSEISLNPNPPISTFKALQLQSVTRQRFEVQDRQYGPLKIGDIEVNRTTLFDMNATIDGRPIRPEETANVTADPSWKNRLQLDASTLVESSGIALEKRDSFSDFAYNLATQRGATEPSVIASTSSPSESEVTLKTLLDQQQRVSKDTRVVIANGPAWLDIDGSNAAHAINAGLRMFGIYGGIKGLINGAKSGDTEEIGIQSVSLINDVGTEAVTTGVSAKSAKAVERGKKLWDRFSNTGAAKLIKGIDVGSNVVSAGLDAYQIISSVHKALDAKTPEERELHWVSAGVSAANIAISIAATSLYFASPALAAVGSPIVLGLTVLLMVGQGIYSATVQVSEIDKYRPLSGWEKLETGIALFAGGNASPQIEHDYKVGKSRDTYFNNIQESAERRLNWELKEELGEALKGALHDSTETIVSGTARTTWSTTSELETRAGSFGHPRRITRTKEVTTTNSGDDNFDLSDGISDEFSKNQDIRVIHGERGENKAIRFEVGDGNDNIVGVKAKSNHFIAGNGKKNFKGGDKDDAFVIQPTDTGSSGGVLSGGAGNDRLFINSGSAQDVTVDLRPNESGQGKLTIRDAAITSNSAEYSLESIESVTTSKDSSTKVIGSNSHDIIHSQGADHVDADDGNDQIIIGSTASGEFSGGKGFDRYVIENGAGAVTLKDDPSDGARDSQVTLKWKLGQIQGFRTEGTSLIIESKTDTGEPGRTIILADYFKEKLGAFKSYNDKWSFFMEDGYLVKLSKQKNFTNDTRPNDKDLKATVIKIDGKDANYDVRMGGDDAVVDFSQPNPPTMLQLEYRSGDVESIKVDRFPTIVYQGGESRRPAYVVVKFRDGKELRLKGIPSEAAWKVRLVTQDGISHEIKSPAVHGDNNFKVLENGSWGSQVTQRTLVSRSYPILTEDYTVSREPSVDKIVLRGTAPTHQIFLANGGLVKLESESPTEWRLNVKNVIYGKDEVQLLKWNILLIGKATWVHLPDRHQRVTVIDRSGNEIFSVSPSSP
ncbi:hypothetical protein [Burkholderia pyrrocinia]